MSLFLPLFLPPSSLLLSPSIPPSLSPFSHLPSSPTYRATSTFDMYMIDRGGLAIILSNFAYKFCLLAE